jgi:serine/threonine-protein kinase
MANDKSDKNESALMIGRYRVRRRIGSGGMGAVYRAVDTQLGREVALKILAPVLASQPAMLARFRSEALHASKLRHQHIVALYEFGEAKGIYFLVMEYVKGCDLHDYIERRGKLPEEEARQFTMQAAKALTLAHEHGIVHRDIKPSNLLLTREEGRPIVKLTDFGLAMTETDEDLKVTRAGSTVGTVDYIAPEQARNSRSADIRSDIYSLGCTLFHMLAGQPPFPGGELGERLLKHVESPPPDLRTFNDQVSEGMVSVVLRMLAKRPEDRYQTPAELFEELKKLPTISVLKPREVLEALSGLERKKARPPARAIIRKRATPPLVERVEPQATVLEDATSAERTPAPLREHKRRESLSSVEDAASAESTPASLRKHKRREPLSSVEDAASAESTPASLRKHKRREPLPSVEDAASAESAPAPLRKRKRENIQPSNFHEPIPDYVEQSVPADVEQSMPGDAEQSEAEPGSGRNWPLILAVVSGLVLAGAAVTFLLIGLHREGRTPAMSRAVDGQAAGKILPDKSFEGLARPGNLFKAPIGVPGTPAKEAGGNRQVAVAAPKPSVPSTTIILVSRLGVPDQESSVNSLSAAWDLAAKAVPPKAVIEIHDDGPWYVPPLAARGKDLTVRAGKGYRPLIAWNGQGIVKEPGHLFTLENGSLTLENLDIVARCSEAGKPGLAGLVHLVHSDLAADDSSFSLSGRLQQEGSLICWEGTAQDDPPRRFRLTRCFLRGTDSMALALKDAAGEVQIERCLLLGGSQPLVDVLSESKPPGVRLRVGRSTLVSGRVMLRVRPPKPEAARPQVDWLGTQTLIAHSPGGAPGPMILYAGAAESNGLLWRGQHCRYCGWQTLFESPNRSVHATNLTEWGKLTGQDAAERVIPSAWPNILPADLAQASAAAFRVTPVNARDGDGPADAAQGCPVGELSGAPENWLFQTYSRSPVPQLEAARDELLEIPHQADGLYAGENLDLGQVDLGEYLEQMKTKQRFAPKVVLRLTGSGKVPTQRLRVEQSHLVFYFEPGSRGVDKLTLVPAAGTNQEALVEVSGGRCDIIGARFGVAEGAGAEAPPCLFKVKGGELRLTGCSLIGPPASTPSKLEALISLDEAGDHEQGRVSRCVLMDSTLVAGTKCIQSAGTAVSLRLKNCVAVAQSDVFDIAAGRPAKVTTAPPFVVEESSLAARRAIFHVWDKAGTGPITPVRILALGNAFLSPATSAQEAALFLGKDRLLAHGGVVWEGTSNGYDRRLPCFVRAQDSPALQTIASLEDWTNYWGPFAERSPIALDLPEQSTFDFTTSSLPFLILPRQVGDPGKARPPGADFEKLAITK